MLRKEVLNSTPAPGKIRVGRIKNQGASLALFKKHYPSFKPCIVLSASSTYGDLSPFCLKDPKGRLIENIWQFSKVYEKIPKIDCRKSRYDQTIIFSSKAQVHINENSEPNELYWEWRKRGQEAKEPIRYPVGFDLRHRCLYSIKDDEDRRHLDYIQSRKEIYLPIYLEAVKKEKKFKELKKKLEGGQDLLILEVDGPRGESLRYYMDSYGVSESFIDCDTTLATEEHLKIFLNDVKHPFGHGFCLAAALLEIDLLKGKSEGEGKGENEKTTEDDLHKEVLGENTEVSIKKLKGEDE